MHVYHYAAYEPSTLARLMGTHATREEEVDELLRKQVFVDLLQVVRQSLRAGVESYSLKDVEKLFFTRKAEVSSGNEAVIEFERWLDDRDDARLEAIAAYNEEDCLATLELRDWLLAQREKARRDYGVEIPFLPPPEPYTPAEEETSETTRAPRRAAREGGRRRLARAAGTAPRVPQARGAACVVVVLPPPHDDRRRARRRRRGDRLPRARRR